MSKARELASLGNAYSDGSLSNRNLIINGAMQVAQRGTSFTANGYTLDRWILSSNNTPPTVTQETGVFSLGGKSIKMVTDASNGYAYVGQKIEDLSFFSGKTITVSFDYKATNNFYVSFEYHYGTGGSASEYTKHQTLVSASASATRISITVTIDDLSAKTFGPSSTSHLDLLFNSEVANPTTIEITNVQLEVGDTATPFEHRSYGQELALCQRFYQKSNKDGYYQLPSSSGGQIQRQYLRFSPTMRTAPTMTTTKTGGSAATAVGIDGSERDGLWFSFGGNQYDIIYWDWTADAEL